MSLQGPFQEQDWKYMRSIHDELLHALCTRINDQAVALVRSRLGNPHDRYLELFTHIKESDRIVAECFNDWRRSNIDYKIIALRHYGLLQDAHVEYLNPEVRQWLTTLEERNKS